MGWIIDFVSSMEEGMKCCYMLILIAIIGLTEGCSTPVIYQADLRLIAKSNLSFLQTRVTTRDTVLLKMGLPSARFENDRILIYQVLPKKDGGFRILAPSNMPYNELRQRRRGTHSLVLVFSDDILDKMGLVGSE